MSRTRTTPDRDTTIAAAIRDRKIRAQDAERYRQMFDGNPAAIRNLLTARVEQGGLMPGLARAEESAAAAGGYDESWLTPREREALAKQRTAPAPAAAPATPPPAAPAPAAASAAGEPDDEYDPTWLAADERNRITAAKEGRLDPEPVQFEDAEARRAAGAGR